MNSLVLSFYKNNSKHESGLDGKYGGISHDSIFLVVLGHHFCLQLFKII